MRHRTLAGRAHMDDPEQLSLTMAANCSYMHMIELDECAMAVEGDSLHAGVDAGEAANLRQTRSASTNHRAADLTIPANHVRPAKTAFEVVPEIIIPAPWHASPSHDVSLTSSSSPPSCNSNPAVVPWSNDLTNMSTPASKTKDVKLQKIHYPLWFGGSASCFAACVTHPLDLREWH